MADCYQKLGDAESQKIYERIVREYVDQKDAVTMARARLATLSAASTTLRAFRLVTNDSPSETFYETLSPDGQWLGGTDWMNGDLVLRHVSTGEVRRLV